MIHFGTGGWRAVIGDEFTRQNLRILAKAMCDKMHEELVASEGTVIGYDRRFLSKESMRWMAEVIAAEQIHVKLINRSVPTPLTMFYVQKNDLPYGMMVTASHNPAVYNGVKVFTRGGRDADERQTADIERYIAAVDEKSIRSVDYEEGVRSGMIEEIYPMNEYVDSIISAVNMNAIRDAGLRIALDPMYGVSETAIRTILVTARCQVDSIHDRHDTLFGGKLPAPNEETLLSLKTFVIEGGYDLGIATDGDADRLGVIDDKGRFLHPNDILVLLYYYLVKYRGWRGPAVRSICTTHLLDRVAGEFGQECYEVPVGFKYVSAKMNETGAIIGGESSGGLAVKGHIRGKDGVYAACLLVEMLAVAGRKLSDIVEEVHERYGHMPFGEHSYRFCADEKERIRKVLLVDRSLPHLPWEISRISYVDGLILSFENGGWVSVRFSGTEPLLRIFCEMPTQAEAADATERFESFLGLPRG